MLAEQTADQGTAGPGGRVWLRDATRDLHAAAEDKWMPMRRFASEDGYRGFLSALLQAHHRLGRPAALRRADHDDIRREEARITALCQDLGTAPPAPAAPTEMAERYAWGVSYVLNGSALGAALLLGQNHVGPRWPRAYLTQSQQFAKSGALRDFLDRMDSLPAHDHDLLQGASDTFRLVASDPPLGRQEAPDR